MLVPYSFSITANRKSRVPIYMTCYTTLSLASIDTTFSVCLCSKRAHLADVRRPVQRYVNGLLLLLARSSGPIIIAHAQSVLPLIHFVVIIVAAACSFSHLLLLALIQSRQDTRCSHFTRCWNVDQGWVDAAMIMVVAAVRVITIMAFTNVGIVIIAALGGEPGAERGILRTTGQQPISLYDQQHIHICISSVCALSCPLACCLYYHDYSYLDSLSSPLFPLEMDGASQCCCRGCVLFAD